MKIMSKISSAIKTLATTAKMKAIEDKPQLLIAGGVTLLIGAGVVACVQTARKMNDILDEAADKIDGLNCLPSEELQTDGSTLTYTDKERAHDIFMVKLRTTGKIVVLYSPAIAMASVGVVLVGLGTGEFKRRHAITLGTLNSTIESYKAYRKRIIDKYGEEADKYGLYGLKSEEYTEEEIDEETGKKRKVKKIRDIFDPDDLNPSGSPYFRRIGPGTALWEEWHGDPIYIRQQLELYQQVFDQQFQSKLPVYANDIYRAIFGVDEDQLSDDGQIAGYFWPDPENRAKCDEHVDLRIGVAYVQGVDENGDKTLPTAVFYIDPNIPGEISLERARQNRKRSGRWISS